MRVLILCLVLSGCSLVVNPVVDSGVVSDGMVSDVGRPVAEDGALGDASAPHSDAASHMCMGFTNADIGIHDVSHTCTYFAADHFVVVSVNGSDPVCDITAHLEVVCSHMYRLTIFTSFNRVGIVWTSEMAEVSDCDGLNWLCHAVYTFGQPAQFMCHNSVVGDCTITAL